MNTKSRTRNNNAIKPTSVKSAKGHEPAKSGQAAHGQKIEIIGLHADSKIIRPCIDRELAEEANRLTAVERLRLADKLHNWSNDLRNSVSKGELPEGFKIIESVDLLYFQTVGNRNLDVICANWGPVKRRKVAEKIAIWGKLLLASADLMDGKPVLGDVN